MFRESKFQHTCIVTHVYSSVVPSDEPNIIADNANNDVTDNEENDRIGYVDEIKPGKSTVSAAPN